MTPPSAPDADAVRRRFGASPRYTPYSDPAYAACLREALGVGWRLFTARAASHEAFALVYERRALTGRRAVVPPLTAYTPIVADPPPRPHEIAARAAATEALAAQLEDRYRYAALHLHPADADVRALTWRGWKAQPLYTYLLPLGADDAQARWSAATRRTYTREAVRFAVGEEPEAAAAIAGLCAESYARHGRRPPAPVDRLARLVGGLQACGMARLFAARPASGGPPEAGLAVLRHGATAYYWVAGSRPGPAMTVLLGGVLPLLAREGVRTFDFVGANTPSIAEFKRRFGAELQVYYRVQKSNPGAFLGRFVAAGGRLTRRGI